MNARTPTSLRLPSVDRALATDAMRALAAQYGHSALADALRAEFDALRPQALAGELAADAIADAALHATCERRLAARFAPRWYPRKLLAGSRSRRPSTRRRRRIPDARRRSA